MKKDSQLPEDDSVSLPYWAGYFIAIAAPLLLVAPLLSIVGWVFYIITAAIFISMNIFFFSHWDYFFPNLIIFEVKKKDAEEKSIKADTLHLSENEEMSWNEILMNFDKEDS